MTDNQTPLSTNPVLPISELNRRVRALLEGSVPLLWVGGEISNFTRAASGHWYFSLKDANAQVRCVMFRHKRESVDWLPADGMEVEARVTVTLYEPRGDYQLNVENLRRAGLGALYERFERLKVSLAAEGLFDAMRKKPLPKHARTVGVITSSAGAALHDVLTCLRRRDPRIAVVIYPTPVQGQGAARIIAETIATAGQRAECDVLILCRGGGSIEDLWQFNEEIVARAIAACALPLICGVGHETDFTIADFVADQRAPTPTAAAEMVSVNSAELLRYLLAGQTQLRRRLVANLERRMLTLDHLARRLSHPGERLRRQADGLRLLGQRLLRAEQSALRQWHWQAEALVRRLRASLPDLRSHRTAGQHQASRLNLAMTQVLQRWSDQVAALQTQLTHLDPEAVLERGYSIVATADGSIVRDASTLSPGDRLRLRFSKGSASAEVTTTNSE